jgi:uncharacterized membrane protein YtjA (UPF0391 family)
MQTHCQFDRRFGISLACLLQWISLARKAREQKGVAMLYYALVFLIIALVAGALGFGVVAFAAAEIARICFFIFIVLFLVSLIAHLFRRTTIP